MYLSYFINAIKVIDTGFNFYSSLTQLRCTEFKSQAVLKDVVCVLLGISPASEV